MNIFKSKGFDAVVSAGMVVTGDVVIDGVLQVSGTINGHTLWQRNGASGGASGSISIADTGKARVKQLIAHNLTVAGDVECDTLQVEDTLTLVKGATVKAATIYYRNLVIAPGANLLGNLKSFSEVPSSETASSCPST